MGNRTGRSFIPRAGKLSDLPRSLRCGDVFEIMLELPNGEVLR